ncbi:phosphodiester glycosidase family protein [Terrimonas alba]|uniref:phosphodiester glycosidase family protein n=1 Tax=Terrimonas alba TaxID=3349636 RepID=UPI0035F39CC8
MTKIIFPPLLLLFSTVIHAQLKWQKMDTAFASLPASVHVYRTIDSLDGKPNIAWYLEADLKEKHLEFTVDTTLNRRLTPQQFYEKNGQPLLVVNTTFFSFATNQSLNVVVKDGKLVSYNIHSIAGRGKDTLLYHHPTASAIGISKKGEADVAWLYTDSSLKYPVAFEEKPVLLKDSSGAVSKHSFVPELHHLTKTEKRRSIIDKWKMKTAVGGGPVLLQNGDINITNEEERKFYGKAINDKHPRTAMGYTKDNKLIILVVEGRNTGIAEGATLGQLALLFRDLGCVEALNLDGGGSSCMLVNGKETIRPSDKKQRAVPAVFMIKEK